MRGVVIAAGHEACPRCRGTGEVTVNTYADVEVYPCPNCFGNGSVEKPELMEVA